MIVVKVNSPHEKVCLGVCLSPTGRGQLQSSASESRNDRAKSLDFYTKIVGLKHDGDRDPFSMLRVTPAFVIQIAPWATKGGEHLAFAMSKAEFDDAFGRIRDAGIAFGDRFDSVGNMKGPRDEAASRGTGKAVYFFDPNQHLIEIRHYELS
jgi:catechol 2,3-dioxygenase-like lactoylglutathione lyase family enzyme